MSSKTRWSAIDTGAKGKTVVAIEAVKEKVEGLFSRDDEDEDEDN